MQLDPTELEEIAKTLYIRAVKLLPPDIKRGFERLMAAETDATGRAVLGTMVENIAVAEKRQNLLCQDTGIPELRVMDKQFSSCFVVMFFLYYFLLIAYALNQLGEQAVRDSRGWESWSVFFGAVAVYGIATIWGMATLFQHWRSAWSTKSEPRGKPESRSAEQAGGPQ